MDNKKSTTNINGLETQGRIVIENISPLVDRGRFPVKRAIGEKVDVSADIYRDGHDVLKAYLLHKTEADAQFLRSPMRHVGNDRWEASFSVSEKGVYLYSVEAWTDHFETWRVDIIKKLEAEKEDNADKVYGADMIDKAAERASEKDRKELNSVAIEIRKEKDRARLVKMLRRTRLTELMEQYQERKGSIRYSHEILVYVEREKALFSSWYEFFPRSFSKRPGKHGTLKDCERFLPYIAEMGFDVVYLPPIHPIGKTARKGKNNAKVAHPDDVGSPWAIGSEKGGHIDIHPQLGKLSDLKRFVKKTSGHGMEVALDLAFQCSRDHPFLKEHPEWFKWRPDGSIQFAENPPKKYEDIVPICFDVEEYEPLWQELRNVVFYWMDQGIKIFRVDNPHTKPFAFWEWLIKSCRKRCPDTIFLAEAFTRPKIMKRLAKIGFNQSYTYFTWRNTKNEFIDYMNELTKTGARDYMRPNFWPNTPDILPEHLQYGGRPAFILRLILAGSLSSNYGIYGPAFELCENRALEGKEEYFDSEKYEIKDWDLEREGNIQRIVTKFNRIRKKNKALQETFNIQFCNIDNEQILCYLKTSSDGDNIILIAANMDLYHTQSGWLELPLEQLGIDQGASYMVHELISEDKYVWSGRHNFIQLNPYIFPVHIFRLQKKLRTEQDFDDYA